MQDILLISRKRLNGGKTELIQKTAVLYSKQQALSKPEARMFRYASRPITEVLINRALP